MVLMRHGSVVGARRRSDVMRVVVVDIDVVLVNGHGCVGRGRSIIGVV